MVWLLLLVKMVFAQEECLPYAPRVQLGTYYTDLNDRNNMINILFNTQAACPDAYLTLSGRQIRVLQSTLIDMESIYRDYEPINSHFYKYPYTYSTYVHRVQLGSINAGETYEYVITGASGQSIGSFVFTVPLKYITEQTRVVFFGDMDSKWAANNSKPTFDWFHHQAHVNRSEYDALIYTGDMAYDLESDDCIRGDQFLRNFSTITSNWPIQLIAGNHESGNNTLFPIYSPSFYHPSNQRSGDAFLYSFDIGQGRFIGLNPYRIVYKLAKEEEVEEYFERLKNELIEADNQRETTPWIVVFSHYPLVCPDPTSNFCRNSLSIRTRLISLLEEYGVSLYFGAHEHLYQRQYSSDESTTPAFITEGASGNDKEWQTTDVYATDLPGLAFQSYEQSVGVLTLLNRSHLLFEQVSTQRNTVLDRFYMTQAGNIMKQKSRVWFFICVGLMGVALIIVVVFCLKKISSDRKKTALAAQEYELQTDTRNV